MTKKISIILVAITLFGAFLIWLFVESSKPLPGQKLTDEGREHIEIGKQVSYQTNPPTSGKHYADWIRSGVYSEPKDDRNLVHSLEHGYVIMSYNCDKKFSIFNLQFSINAYAHGTEEATPSAEATSSASLPESFRSDECHKLVDQLISIYEKKGKVRLIVLPRPNLDAKIALTAWNYLDKFDPSTSSGLSVSDMERIEKFIDAHLNQGPEKTIEQ